MSRLFISIYDWFDKHKTAFYVVLTLSVVIFGVMASQIRLQENITNFFNSSDDNKSAIFDNIAAKDKIIVMLSGEEPDSIISAAEVFENELNTLIDEGYIASVTAYADEETMARCSQFVYDYLPIFLSDSLFLELETKTKPENINRSVDNVYNLLTSPSGMVIGDFLLKDPLNLGTSILSKFQTFSPKTQYEIYNGRLFSSDFSTMLMFIQPSNGLGDTGHNEYLVRGLAQAEAQAELNGVEISCIGGPIVAVHNARRIKEDTAITMSIAIAIILLVIFFSFKNRRSIPLIIIPPLFGTLFSLAMMWLIQGEMSAIAIGTGTVVLGISLSYSIHIVAHLNNISSPKEILREITNPLTIGCFTTIGAFAALTFTSSSLLQDFGLFAVFTLIGTTAFCLIFLPQFLKSFSVEKKSALLAKIEYVVGYKYEGNRWVILLILLVTVVALFFFQDVEFDGDMSNINYVPEDILAAEKRSMEILGDDSDVVYIITGSQTLDSLTVAYDSLIAELNRCQDSGLVTNLVTLSDFVISPEEQARRIERWNGFWVQNSDRVLAELERASLNRGFKPHTFSGFKDIVTADYKPCGYSTTEIGDVPVISEWVNSSDEYFSLMSRISVNEEDKDKVYGDIELLPNSIVVDRGYFSSKMVESTSNDFNYILFVSSFIVFLALLISYGRIELTLLTFLPMAISWVIILGMMALFDIKFNIVNIILATFIFGIGDDFSIFIMDGLLQEYKNGNKVLGSHKTAIFFSAFTAIVGMGVMIFAQHPALKSIALISVLGLSVVVLVAYTVQPLLFRWLVTSQTEKGGFPYTLLSILNTLYCFVYFLLGCILAQIHILILTLLPIKKKTKKLSFHKGVYWFTRIFVNTMITARSIRENPYNETFKKPAVIIANHQSFVDVLMLLSLTPKLVMVTKSWVWNSPFFGSIVRYADFYHAADGYELLAERLQERVDEGYSVVIFPEGTRSADCSIQRFHKGPFYLAQLLKLDILPVMIYGAGKISAKTQGFYIKSGIVATKIFNRLVPGDTTFGKTYQEQSKNYRRWFVEQYDIFSHEMKSCNKAYFREALIKNYIYKGPVLEWYIRVKCRLDGYYDYWDKLIPDNAVVADVGCGYGQMSFMLSLLSDKRKIVGIDYDKDKIEVVRHSFLSKTRNVSFVCADMRDVEIPASDVILFNDSLHYINAESQKAIVVKSIASLQANGLIIIRDGDKSKTDTHAKVEHTEVWSTRIFKHNKTTDSLCFVSSAWMQQLADENGIQLQIERCDNSTSETFYLLRKR